MFAPIQLYDIGYTEGSADVSDQQNHIQCFVHKIYYHRIENGLHIQDGHHFDRKKIGTLNLWDGGLVHIIILTNENSLYNGSYNMTDSCD